MPLGFFDSGVGGLTVYRKVRERLPDYDALYLGDTARTPYGSRSFDAILRFTTEGVEHLFAQGCPLVLIACNTASAKALRTIQQKLLPAKWPDRRVL
ncbi:MAG TPA: glutamate racemase, partial [Fibrobacteria bacterium]|nr:glutamate racemase [Fibrobacteria bacterium]